MIRVNIIGWNNGVGLTRDMRLVAQILSSAGFDVRVRMRRRGKLHKWLTPVAISLQVWLQRLTGTLERRRADINLMFERIYPEYLPLARHSWLVPNPEWLREDERALLAQLAGVLVKTRHALSIFDAMGMRTEFIGFTSEDCLDQAPRTRTFFHLAGRSGQKGTQQLIALWQRHPHWPPLCIVQNPITAGPPATAANIVHRVDYVAVEELRRLQNQHVFHLCPSETEGFGHYLVEAMSVGAVAVTLDAEPMNELVQPDRGLLVAAGFKRNRGLARAYQPSDPALAAAIEHAIALPQAECDRIGRNARHWYEDNDRRFRRTLVETLRRLATQ